MVISNSNCKTNLIDAIHEIREYNGIHKDFNKLIETLEKFWIRSEDRTFRIECLHSEIISRFINNTLSNLDTKN